MKCVLDTLEKFGALSGQVVSMEKTQILFSRNVDRVTRSRLTQQSGFKETAHLGRYLGVPLIGRAPRQADFRGLIEKVRNKLSGWKADHLSFTGRVTLSKAVIQAIPVYTMMTMPIPKSCLNEIQRLQRRFVWGDNNQSRKWHAVKWSVVTMPRHLGGLGILNLASMNKACLMKMGWALREGDNALWSRLLRGKYGHGLMQGGNIVAKAMDSFIWKGVVRAWNGLAMHEAWALGDGTSVNVWADAWLPGNSRLKDLVLEVPHDMRAWRVCDLLDGSGHWNLEALEGIVPNHVLGKFAAIPTPNQESGPDRRVWPGERLGRFSVSSAYKLVSGNIWWDRVWRLEVPERVKYFVWQVMHGRLPTHVACHRWGQGDPWCHHCYGVEETVLHAIRDCSRASLVWNHLLPLNLRVSFFAGSLSEWARANLECTEPLEHGMRWRDLWAIACHSLWRWRNKEVHDERFIRPHHPSRHICLYAASYANLLQGLDVENVRASSTIWVRWLPPVQHWVRLNTDGAARGQGGTAGCGGVLRDGDGHWLCGFAKPLGQSCAYIAELWGAYEGLLLTRERGSEVELRLDSQVVVRNLQGKDSGSVQGWSLVHRIRRLLALPWRVKIGHIYREANTVANGLANLGCELADYVRFEEAPTHVRHLVFSDLIGVSTPRCIGV